MDMTHTRVSAMRVKERKDECQMLRMSYFREKKKRKRREKEIKSWAGLSQLSLLRWASGWYLN